MHTVRLKLKMHKTTRRIAQKRFYALWHIHNTLVKHAKKQLGKLYRDKEYLALLDEYHSLKDSLKDIENDKQQKKRHNELKKLLKKHKERYDEVKKLLKKRQAEFGLTSSDFEKWILPCSKQFSQLVSSQQVQKEADRVFKGVEDVLYKKGKDAHFKRYYDLKTISTKSATNGCKFDQENLTIDWMGTIIKCQMPKDENSAAYVKKSLRGKLKYCEIVREMFNNGWHYYVNLYIDSEPIAKLDGAADKTNIAGVDPGVSTMAVVSNESAMLKELAPMAADYERRIHKIQRAMGRSRRASNPERYNEDGTYKKGSKGKFKQSNTYRKLNRQLQTLYRKKTAYVLQSHRETINGLLLDCVNFIIEKMNYAALAKRSKSEPERSDKTSTIKDKDGNTKTVRKFKKKKRFGHSINSRSPALFITNLKNRAEQYGGSIIEIDPKEYKASQYNHDTDEYIKIPLSQRSKKISNHEVQRDLYSAFLLQNPNPGYKSPDRVACTNKFSNFIILHDACIDQMRQNNVTMKQCFGF